MTRLGALVRRLVLVFGIGTSVAISGCGEQEVAGIPAESGVAGSDASGLPGALESFDMCTVMSDQELQYLGLRLDTKEPDETLGAVGCVWLGDPYLLGLSRNPHETIAGFAERRDSPQFTTFKERSVADRDGVQIRTDSAGEGCSQLMAAGSGTVLVLVRASSSQGPPVDPCAEALRIAQMIEPRLPEVGS
jgi:hypothetical protein